MVAVFQPHRYSRTEDLWRDFADSFVDADLLVVTDVYAAGEAPRPGVTGKLIVNAVLDAHPWARVAWLPHRADVVGFLAHELTAGDLCLTLGAGDITTLADDLLPALVRPDRRAFRAGDPSDAIEAAAARLGAQARRGVDLGGLTTYRVGGAAALFVTVDSEADLAALLAAVHETHVPTLAVGRGSNLLVADSGFAGVAFRLGGRPSPTWAGSVDGRAGRRAAAGGAVALPVLARATVAAGLTGFEWAVGVPGSVGGAVRMNAGGHGSDMAASLVRVRVVDLRGGEDKEVPARSLALSYRGSAITSAQVVVRADLGLAPGDRAASEAELAEIVRWRRANQPGGQNAGSVFTNPPGESAGRLIEAAGAKGLRIGTAEVSTKHANFIQADAGGRAADVFALMAEVRRRVREHSGVDPRARDPPGRLRAGRRSRRRARRLSRGPRAPTPTPRCPSRRAPRPGRRIPASGPAASRSGATRAAGAGGACWAWSRRSRLVTAVALTLRSPLLEVDRIVTVRAAATRRRWPRSTGRRASSGADR